MRKIKFLVWVGWVTFLAVACTVLGWALEIVLTALVPDPEMAMNVLLIGAAVAMTVVFILVLQKTS